MRSASSARAVSTMMGSVLKPRTARVTSRPSMPGRPRSRIIRSGFTARTWCRAASPSPASSTAKPACSRKSRTRRAIEGSSSTIRMVFTASDLVVVRPARPSSWHWVPGAGAGPPCGGPRQYSIPRRGRGGASPPPGPRRARSGRPARARRAAASLRRRPFWRRRRLGRLHAARGRAGGRRRLGRRRGRRRCRSPAGPCPAGAGPG